MLLELFIKVTVLLWTFTHANARQDKQIQKIATLQSQNHPSIQFQAEERNRLTNKVKNNKVPATPQPSLFPSLSPKSIYYHEARKKGKGRQTESPSYYPSTAPSESCDFSKVQIIDLADPFDNPNGTLIQLYFPGDNCRNQTIPDNLLSFEFEGTNSSSAILSRKIRASVKGKTNDNGIAAYCSSNSPYNGCTEELEEGEKPDPGGCVKVCEGPPSSCDVKSKYGKCQNKRGLQNDQSSDYASGQVVRIRLNTPEQGAEFIPENWNITLNVTAAKINETIGRWRPQYNVPIVITEVFMLTTNATARTFSPRVSSEDVFFVELYGLDKKDRGSRFSEEMKLVRLDANNDPDWNSAVPLDYIPDDGFIIICSEAARNKWNETKNCITPIDDFWDDNNGNAFAVINGFEEFKDDFILGDKVGTSNGKILMQFIFL